MVLVIDNYDSFTFNLVHGLGAVRPGLDMRVERNDRVTARGVWRMRPSAIVISPGPCGPADAGASVEIIRAHAGRVPILGVCLGHQCIAEAMGLVVRRHRAVHGKPSPIHHDGRTIFAGLRSPMSAMRYHSLIVEPPRDSAAALWDVSAWTTARSSPDRTPLVMGLRRRWPVGAARTAPLEGVQFHPESFRTPAGRTILANFLHGALGPPRRR